MKQKTLFISFGLTLSVVFVIIILSMLIASIATFELDLIPSFVIVSVGFVVLLIIVWIKFVKNENTTNIDDRYDD